MPNGYRSYGPLVSCVRFVPSGYHRLSQVIVCQRTPRLIIVNKNNKLDVSFRSGRALSGQDPEMSDRVGAAAAEHECDFWSVGCCRRWQFISRRQQANLGRSNKICASLFRSRLAIGFQNTVDLKQLH